MVLPLDYTCVELPNIFKRATPRITDRRGEYMTIPLSAAETERFGHVESVLTLLFNRLPDEVSGNEGHVLTNGRFGDVFDIIYADATDRSISCCTCRASLRSSSPPARICTLSGSTTAPIAPPSPPPTLPSLLFKP